MTHASVIWRRFVLGVIITCFMTSLISIGAFSVPQTAHAATLSVSAIEKQSASLYESLRHQNRSQAEIDTVLQRQFGLQRTHVSTTASPLTSTNSAVNLPATTIYRSRGTIFLYSNFTWNCASGASCYSDPLNYNDVFGVWFSQSIPVHGAYLSVTDVTGTSKLYENPVDFKQIGVDYSEEANYWVSGVLEVSLAGDFPAGCTEISTMYTHGWTSNEPTSVTISAGFPGGIGMQVTYTQVSHSWQVTSPSPSFVPGPGDLSPC